MIDQEEIGVARQRAQDILTSAEERSLDQFRAFIGKELAIKRGMITVIGTVVDVERNPSHPDAGWRFILEYDDPFAHRRITTWEAIR